MRLALHAESAAGLVRIAGGRQEKLAAEDFVGVFDVIRVPAGEGTIDVLLYNEHSDSRRRINLPRGTEVTYADLLRIHGQQHRLELTESARRLAAPSLRVRVTLGTDPLLLQAVRALEKAMADAEPAEPQIAPRGPIGKGTAGPAAGLRWWLADFWLF